MKLTIAAVALAFAALGAPATAQTASHDAMAPHDAMKTDAMASHDAMKADAMASVKPGDRAKVGHCKAMSHDAMAANATCGKMMKLYPAAFDTGPMVN